MTPIDLSNQEKLEEVYKVTIENNEILRSLRRQQRIANAFRILYWLVILISIGGAYYYVRPIVTAFTGNSIKVQEGLNQFDVLRKQFPEAQLLEKFINSIQSENTAPRTQN